MSKVGLFIIKEHKSSITKKKIFNEFLKILNDDLENVVFSETKDGLDTLYVFLDIEKQKKIYDLFKKYSVLSSYKDLTKNFLYQKNLDIIFNNDEFKKILIKFLDSNLDKDTVLDKINDLGISSLNEIDYNILKK
jgi:hypothetical protein